MTSDYRSCTGCETKKLKFGHHGGNHPVKDLTTGNVFITSQNHNYIVADLPDTVEETFVNVNDGTYEGIRHKLYQSKAFSST